MLKVVVFDSGYGGELFADYLQENLPIIQIIRVIDWRNADQILLKPKDARRVAEAALRPYISKTDLIILANHLVTITSLKYFKRKYKNQKFVGMNLKYPDTKSGRDTLILTTKAVARTINYHNFIFRLKCRTKTLTLDAWPAKIDDGELTMDEISETLKVFTNKENIFPEEVILACSQFNDIKSELRACLGRNLKIYDSFNDTYRAICKILRLRGGVGKKKS